MIFLNLYTIRSIQTSNEEILLINIFEGMYVGVHEYDRIVFISYIPSLFFLLTNRNIKSI